MNEDTVVIPLRVSREQRQRWRELAAREDKSVQQWLLWWIDERLVEVVAPKPVSKAKVVELPANPKPVPVAEKKVEEVVIKPTRWCGVCARQVDSWKMKDGLAICERHWKDLE